MLLSNENISIQKEVEMDENASTRESINIIELLMYYLKHWLILLVAGLIVAGGTLAGMLVFTVQEYTASAMMYVNNSTSFSDAMSSIKQITSGDLSAARSIVDLYCIIIETRTNLDKVAERCNDIGRYYPALAEDGYSAEYFGHEDGYKYSYENLIKKIDVQSVNSTEIFEIKMQSANPEEAIFIVNVIATIARTTISDIVEGTSVKSVDEAQVAEKVPRHLPSLTLLGFLGGVVLAGVVLFFIYYYNDTISSEDYLKNSFEGKIPLLAVVPDSIRGISRKKGYHRYSYYDYYETKDKKDNK